MKTLDDVLHSAIEAMGFKETREYNSSYTLKDPDHDEIKDGYQLRWVGKNYAKLQENLAPETVIVPDSLHNAKPRHVKSQNLFLTGDNLEVLKHLEYAYTGKVDIIYIDPLYNTGSDGFVYEDTFNFTDSQLRSTLGLTDEEVRRIRNLNGKSSHSAWLTFMYPRLKLARKLLKDTGVIFVSIDDNEQANLKLLMDEVFAEGNLVGVVPVIMNLKGNQDAFGFAETHDYVLVYAKTTASFTPGRLQITDEESLEWLEDEHGIYKEADNLRATGVNAPRAKRPNLWYPIFVSSNDLPYVTEDDAPLNAGDEVVWPINPEGQELSWYWSKPTFRDNDHNLIVKRTSNGTQFYRKQRPKLGDDSPTKKPKSVLFRPEYSTSTSTIRLRDLMEGRVFETPKPVPYICDLLSIGGTKDSLILDFFAGSGATAHAVMRLNKDDGGKRRYILCNIDEPVKKGSEAETAGYTTIDQIARKRIELAAQELGDTSGFRHYRFLQPLERSIEQIEDFDPAQPRLLADDMISPFSEKALVGTGSDDGVATILTTWLVDDGYDFDTHPASLDLAGYTAHYAENIARLYLISNQNWSSDSCKQLINLLGRNEIAVNTIVIYPYSFAFTDLTELKNNLRANLDKTPQIIERY
jgi:adenine-specific DNA-methyltransferase